MRSRFLATSILALVFPVSSALAQQHCAAPVATAFAAGQIGPQVPSEPRIPLLPPVSVGSPARSLPTPTPLALPDRLPKPQSNASDPQKSDLQLGVVDPRSSPALRHISAAGAALTDLGLTHGLRTVFAKHGSQFMIFELTPDNEATVAGLVTEVSLDQLQSLAGGNITPLAPAHGLKGYFLRNGPSFQVFYTTPDGKAVIPGVMWDATGKDVTRDQVATIPGAIPTVVIGDVPPALRSATNAEPDRLAPSVIDAAERTTYGTIGNEGAPQLWMFIDPQCTFSIRAMQQLQPYVASGRVQLHVIPLAFLDGEDNGLSTRRALQLVAAPTDQLVQAWETGQSPQDGTSAEAGLKLQANMGAADALQVKGTPTFLWRKNDGSSGRFDGLPPSIDALLGEIGS